MGAINASCSREGVKLNLNDGCQAVKLKLE